MAKLEVTSTQYTATLDDGYEVVSTAYKENEIESAMSLFIEDAAQVSECFCKSDLLNGRLFKFVKDVVA